MSTTNKTKQPIDFVYTGQENLEAMQQAVNYNKYLVSLVTGELKNKETIQNPRILDFGAGIGTYADMLKEKGYSVDCLELDLDQVNQLESKGYRVYEDLRSIKAKYDIVYAFNVFEHIEDDKAVFKMLSEKLTNDGSVIIYVPAFPLLFSSMDSLVGHHRRYKLDRLKDMASQAQLEISYLGYAEPIGFLAAIVYKLFGNNDGTITPRAVKFYDKVAFPGSRILSPVFKHLFGKNAVLVAVRKSP